MHITHKITQISHTKKKKLTLLPAQFKNYEKILILIKSPSFYSTKKILFLIKYLFGEMMQHNPNQQVNQNKIKSAALKQLLLTNKAIVDIICAIIFQVNKLLASSRKIKISESQIQNHQADEHRLLFENIDQKSDSQHSCDQKELKQIIYQQMTYENRKFIHLKIKQKEIIMKQNKLCQINQFMETLNKIKKELIQNNQINTNQTQILQQEQFQKILEWFVDYLRSQNQAFPQLCKKIHDYINKSKFKEKQFFQLIEKHNKQNQVQNRQSQSNQFILRNEDDNNFQGDKESNSNMSIQQYQINYSSPQPICIISQSAQRQNQELVIKYRHISSDACNHQLQQQRLHYTTFFHIFMFQQDRDNDHYQEQIYYYLELEQNSDDHFLQNDWLNNFSSFSDTFEEDMFQYLDFLIYENGQTYQFSFTL